LGQNLELALIWPPQNLQNFGGRVIRTGEVSEVLLGLLLVKAMTPAIPRTIKKATVKYKAAPMPGPDDHWLTGEAEDFPSM